MKKIIERLDIWLKENRKDFYDSLNPGLTDNEIQEWEQKFGFEFPEDFKILYKWKNGQPDQNREYFFDICWFNEMDIIFYEWETGCEDLIEFNEDDEIAWGESWLLFFSNVVGDGYCLDVGGDLGNPGNIIYFIHNDENDVVFTSIKKMMEMLVVSFEQGMWGYFEEEGKQKFELINQEKWDNLFDQYTE